MEFLTWLKTDFLTWLKDFEPALAVLIAVVALLVSVLSTAYQQRRSVELVRYEAVRSKRATAKAIREEIALLKDLEGDADVDPIVFQSLCPSVGRLNEKSIASVVKFYGGYAKRSKVGGEEMRNRAAQAIADLDKFLESTEAELDRLSYSLKVD